LEISVNKKLSCIENDKMNIKCRW